MSRPFPARPAPPQKFEVAKSSKPLTHPTTPPMPGLVRHQQATQRYEQKKRNEAKALKRRQSRGLVLRERDSNTQNLDARFEKRKAYDAELKRRQALRTVQAAQEADEARDLMLESMKKTRETTTTAGSLGESSLELKSDDGAEDEASQPPSQDGDASSARLDAVEKQLAQLTRVGI